MSRKQQRIGAEYFREDIRAAVSNGIAVAAEQSKALKEISARTENIVIRGALERIVVTLNTVEMELDILEHTMEKHRERFTINNKEV